MRLGDVFRAPGRAELTGRGGQIVCNELANRNEVGRQEEGSLLWILSNEALFELSARPGVIHEELVKESCSCVANGVSSHLFRPQTH